MKKEKYLIKAKHTKIIRVALSVLLCVVFIPLLLTSGILIVKGALNQGRLTDIVDVTTMIVQPKLYIDKTTPVNDQEFTSKDDVTTIIKEPESEKAVLPSQEFPQETTENNISTNAGVETRKEPSTTAVYSTTTRPAAKQPATTKPATTKPPTTRPTTTQPTTTKPATTQPATTKPPTTSNVLCIHLPADEQTMLNLINQERKCNGLPELKLDTSLRNVARTKSREMIALNYFAHQSPEYGSPFEMMAHFGIKYSKAGENLALSPSVERAHSGLMDSDSHRKAILNPDYTHIGIGAYQGVSGKYYTQMFACY